MRLTETVAIIDDDTIYQFTAKRTIESLNIIKNISVFSNGKDAIDFFLSNLENSKKLPDIVFLDINMPVMNGWEFLEQYALLKPKLSKQISIYVVSSSIDENDLMRVTDIPEVDDYFVKPITIKELKSILFS